MTAHKYKVGQSVGFGGGGYAGTAIPDFKITALIPENEKGAQYRIKGRSEPFERTVNEVELSG